MSDKGLRPCCICGTDFEGWGNNPEPFEGAIGMCCDDCNERFVVPVRVMYGRDGGNAPLKGLTRLASIGAGIAKANRVARDTFRRKA